MGSDLIAYLAAETLPFAAFEGWMYGVYLTAVCLSLVGAPVLGAYEGSPYLWNLPYTLGMCAPLIGMSLCRFGLVGDPLLHDSCLKLKEKSNLIPSKQGFRYVKDWQGETYAALLEAQFWAPRGCIRG